MDATCDVALLTKRQVQEQLLERYKKWAKLLDNDEADHREFRVTVWQEIPPNAKRTAVEVIAMWRGVPFVDIGFATLNTRCGDIWDSCYGVRMAIRKAIAGIARQIALGEKAAFVKTWGPRYYRDTFGALTPDPEFIEERDQDE